MNDTIPTLRPPTVEPRWKRSDSLDLGAYPSAVTSARLRCRAILAEWRLAELSDNCETVVGELMANSVEAHEREGLDAPVRLTLLGGMNAVLIVVRDASGSPPVPASPCLDDETGRGLLIVDALSSWDWKPLPGGGKMIRALVEQLPRIPVIARSALAMLMRWSEHPGFPRLASGSQRRCAPATTLLRYPWPKESRFRRSCSPSGVLDHAAPLTQTPPLSR